MKMFKKITAVFMVVILFMSIMSVGVTAVDSAVVQTEGLKGSDYTNNKTIADRLDEVFSLYPSGSYFTKNGKSCATSAYSNGRCHKHGICTQATNPNCNCMRYWPSRANMQVDLESSQCMGYATFVFWKLYGFVDRYNDKLRYKTPALSDTSAESLYNYFESQQIKTGSHIRMSEPGNRNENAHSISLLSFDQNGIEFMEANYDGYCKVRNNYYTWEDFSKELKKKRREIEYVHVANEYPDGDAIGETTKYLSPDIVALSDNSARTVYEPNQAINISWYAIDDVQSYTIKALKLTGDPGFVFDAPDTESGTVINLTKKSNTEYQIPASYAIAGAALKVAVCANYSDGTTAWASRYIRINPDVPKITTVENNATVVAGTDLTIGWNEPAGAQVYEYKIIELENEPEVGSDAEETRNVIYPLSRTYGTSVTINGNDLPSGRNFKAYVAAIGKDNTSSNTVVYFKTDGTEQNIPLTGIAFENDGVNMLPGNSQLIRPVFTPANATNRVVTYSTNNSAVATVDADGIVTAVSQGSAVITATSNDGGYAASYTVTVGSPTSGKWTEDYNPNINPKITPELVEAFLKTKGGSLTDTITENGQTKLKVNGVVYDLGFDNYYAEGARGYDYKILDTKESAQNLTPAEIIYHQCVRNNMNVVYVLANMQKEQSLISSPLVENSNLNSPQTRLNLAGGYLYKHQSGQSNCGFIGQLGGISWQFDYYANNNGLNMAQAYEKYTPSSDSSNMKYDTFYNDIYLVYAAEFDKLLGAVTVVPENPLTTFDFITPESNQVITYGDYLVSWTDSNSADYYLISMRDVTDGDNEDDEKLVFKRQRVDNTEYWIHQSYFEVGKKYKIAVGACTELSNGKTYELWASARYVQVNPSVGPGSFNFVSPVNNAGIDAGQDVTIKWSDSANASYYLISVRDETTDKLLMERETVNATSRTIPAASLVDGHRYKVAVAAVDSSGADKWIMPYLYFTVGAASTVVPELGEQIETVPGGYTGIYTVENLKSISNNLSGNYILMNDIDLSSVSNWEPIGEVVNGGSGNTFTGVFNGNGYTIRNVCTSSTEKEGVGLFASNSGTITNLNLEIASVGKWRVGGIAGENSGTISNCRVAGTVKNVSSSFDEQNGHLGSYAGGIAGVNTGTITLCSSTASAVGTGSEVMIGGLVGQNWSGGTISKCSATGHIYGGNACVAGGLVGSNNASYLSEDAVIENCFASGNVTGAKAGGLVGQNLNYSAAYTGKGVVRNSYANGFVTGSTNAGGLVGYVACNYEITNSYYNSSKSGCADTGKGKGLNDSQIKQSTSFTGWNFGSVWNVASGINSGYPYIVGLLPGEQNVLGDPASDFTYVMTNSSSQIQITGYVGDRVDITIPAIIDNKPVTSIADYAFQNQASIVSVSLPDTMKTVGNYAFSGCTKLTEVNLGNGVTTIKGNAFRYTAIKSIFIPASASTLDGAFQDTKIETAEFAFGKTTVPNGTFNGVTTLKTVVLPVGITEIGQYAFYGCTALSDIKLPNTLMTIKGYAFGSCSSLKSIFIPKSITTLQSSGSGAFHNSGLEIVEFESEIKAIPAYGFESCKNLTKVVIPSGVESIGNNAFGGCVSLRSITIPDSVTTIGQSAFSGCTALSDVDLGNAVTKIQGDAFYGCTSLKSIFIPKSVTALQSSSNGAFRYSGLETIEFESGIKTIPAYGFLYCQKLTTVEIPSSVETIGGCAFESCTSLKKLTISSGVKTIGNSAFSGCTSLSELIIPDSVTTIGQNAFSGCTALSDVDLGNTVTTIQDSAFYGCTSLKSIFIPKSVTTLSYSDQGAFYNSGLETVEFESGIKTIPAYGFLYCQKLTTVEIPSSVETIGRCAFERCTSLKNLTISSGVKTIGNSAFSGCTSLSELIIPDSVTTIGQSAFSGCTALSDVDLGNGITTIKMGAFSGCTSLKSISIPKSVIGSGSNENPFGNSGLEIVEFEIGLKSIPGYWFQGCESLVTVKIPSSVETIGYSSFACCIKLSSIIIPDSVKTIYSAAFSGCTSLSDVDLGNGVTEIRSLAFQDCPSLKTIFIPKSIVTLSTGSNSAFYASSLETVEFESGLESIPSYSMCGAHVKKVIIPASVTSIGTKAFGNTHEDLTIYGYSGTYAQTYATENSIPFALIVSATDITLTPESVSLFPGDTAQLTATVLPEGVANTSVTWRSMNTDIATVSGDGLVTAKAIGTTKIKVTSWDGGYTAYCDVTVSGANISFQTSAVSLKSGDTFTLDVTTVPENQIVTWSSSDSNVARIRNGVITARNNGTATITGSIEYNGKTYSATCFVTVGDDVVSLSSIEITTKPTKLVYEIGEPLSTTGMVVTAKYSDGSTKTVNASSYKVSGFDSSSSGTKTVTVSYNGKSASFTVTVNAAPVEITLTSIEITTKPTKLVYEIGESLSTAGMVVTAKYSDGSTKTVNASSYTVSGFDSSSSGTKTVTVSYNGKSASFTVTVNAASVEVTLSSIAITTKPTKLVYEIGESLSTAGMVVTAKYSDGSTETINASSCTISGFDSSSAGTKAVTVSYNGKSASFNVTVNDAPVEVTLSSIVITTKPTKLVYEIGESLSTAGMVVTAKYSDGSTETINASSCTISGFDSSSAGTKTVTVSYMRKTASFDVTVNASTTSNPAKLSISSATATAGNKVEITVNVSNNPGFVAAKVLVGYDAEKVKLVNVENGGVITGSSFVTSQNYSANPYIALWNESTASSNFMSNGTLLKLTFEILEGVEECVTPITISYAEDSTFNYNLKPVAFETENGSIEIVERTIGDADGNGTFNLVDVAVIKRALAGWEGYSVNVINADVNGDGKVTLVDVALLERKLAGWDVELV